MAVGVTQRGSDTLPQASVKVPNISNSVMLQGSTNSSTDAAGDTTTPVNVNIVQQGSVAITVGGSDGVAAASMTMEATALWNGASFDQQRNNVNLGALITAVGVTTTQTSSDLSNHNGRGVVVVLDMTVVGTGSVTVSIQGKDTASNKYYTILTGVAVVTNVTNIYTVYPGIAASANIAASNILPRVWRVVVTAGNANPTTYTVGACLMV